MKEIDYKSKLRELRIDYDRLSQNLIDERKEIYRLREVIDKYSFAMDFLDQTASFIESRTKERGEND